MIATPPIKNRAVAQMLVTPSEPPSSEIVSLVDDDPMMLKSIGRLLTSDGFAVQPFDNGSDFIAYVATHEVRLVVLDLWMKKMTGLEVLARLCAVSPRTRVIVITGHGDSAARIIATQIGIVAFLTKPFDDEEFLQMVHRALGHPADTKQSIKPSPRNRFSRVRSWMSAAPSVAQGADR
jgi:two-component system, LuxR family, response regulator FixJ